MKAKLNVLLLDGTGNWSTDGCTTEEANDLNSIICYCNHLTNFALLVVINKKLYLICVH